MNAVEKCVEITEELITVLKANSNDRDKTIIEIEHLLEQRSEWLSKIKSPFSEKDQLIGKRLTILDKEMTNQLKKIQVGIQKDINGLEQRKISAERYTNPYAATEQLDGMFYDQRK
ncbi:hypothetical protein [Lederbergia panacisoli]|uniref:hypothetical protein n=1 Tax=Lederbergia panacisoli TaxID=1255251 RepID=UPI00214B6830|nr:hypothetical protein [Lederbergia panacisoli]MCR2822388.1 hypothetical protein [Lederbergia panacisoli]